MTTGAFGEPSEVPSVRSAGYVVGPLTRFRAGAVGGRVAIATRTIPRRTARPVTIAIGDCQAGRGFDRRARVRFGGGSRRASARRSRGLGGRLAPDLVMTGPSIGSGGWPPQGRIARRGGPKEP